PKSGTVSAIIADRQHLHFKAGFVYQATKPRRHRRCKLPRTMPCAPKPRNWLSRSVSRWPYCGGIFDWDSAPERLADLNKRAEDPNLWSNPSQAQKLMRQRQGLERSIAGYQKLERELDDAMTLIELGTSEDDQASIDEGEATLKQLAEVARRQEVEALLSGEADGNDTYLEVHAGAGGTESQDWAEMLSRMYVHWAEDHDYRVSLVEQSAGEEAGIKSATLLVKGENAYGWLKTESGVHRLV